MYTAHVGRYPSSIGPSPRYIPLTPSSLQIVRAVPIIPWYRAEPGCLCLIALLKDPCACSRVLITSNGQVTIPDAMPPAAPQKLLIPEFENLVEYFASVACVVVTGWMAVKPVELFDVFDESILLGLSRDCG